MEPNWYQYDMAHYDSLSAKVRKAIREHAANVDCDLLVGKSDRAAIAMVKSGQANSEAVLPGATLPASGPAHAAGISHT